MNFESLSATIEFISVRPGETITKDDLFWLREELLRAKHVDKLRLLGLKEDRKAVIGGGLSILLGIFDFLKIDTLKVAKGALRHGVLYDMLAHENEMLDLRNASVQRLARKFNVDEKHAKTVAEVAGKLFEKISTDIEFADGERETHAQKLRWAGLLHEIGCVVSPIDAHLHGAYILAHADPAGFSQSELRCLSQLILGHKAKLKKLEINFTDLTFVIQLICLRLAVILCHTRQTPNLRGIQLSFSNNIIKLSLPRAWQEKYPQSYYLLGEESLVWPKVNWSLEISIDS